MSLSKNYTYFEARIKLGAMSISNDDMPLCTFLIGYFVGRHSIHIDQLFELFDLLAELKEDKLISTLTRKQLLFLVEDQPLRIKDIVKGLD